MAMGDGGKGGGCSACKGWGFDPQAKILVNFSRVGQHMFMKCNYIENYISF